MGGWFGHLVSRCFSSFQRSSTGVLRALRALHAGRHSTSFDFDIGPELTSRTPGSLLETARSVQITCLHSSVRSSHGRSPCPGHRHPNGTDRLEGWGLGCWFSKLGVFKSECRDCSTPTAMGVDYNLSASITMIEPFTSDTYQAPRRKT